jgi:uncharacterized membrane protein
MAKYERSVSLEQEPKFWRSAMHAGSGMAIGAAIGLLLGLTMLENGIAGPLAGVVVGAIVGAIWDVLHKREPAE